MIAGIAPIWTVAEALDNTIELEQTEIEESEEEPEQETVQEDAENTAEDEISAPETNAEETKSEEENTDAFEETDLAEDENLKNAGKKKAKIRLITDDENEPGVNINSTTSYYPIEKGTCGAEGNEENIEWAVYTSGLLYISGTGRMKDYEDNEVPWYKYKDQITVVLVSGSIENIGKNTLAFLYNAGHVSLSRSFSKITKDCIKELEGKRVQVPLGEILDDNNESIGSLSFDILNVDINQEEINLENTKSCILNEKKIKMNFVSDTVILGGYEFDIDFNESFNDFLEKIKLGSAEAIGINVLRVFNDDILTINSELNKDDIADNTTSIGITYEEMPLGYSYEIEFAAVNKTPEYTITYDANGGTDAPKPQKKKEGQNLKLTNIIPTMDGYWFAGWSETPYDPCDEWSQVPFEHYDAGSLYSKDEDTVLYAIWVKIRVEITYNANGGVIADDFDEISYIYHYGEEAIITEYPEHRDGYTFIGWSADKQASVPEYQVGDLYNGEGNIKLYAVWREGEAATYKITYNANGGEWYWGNTVKTEKIPAYISGMSPTRSGYRFYGWSTDKREAYDSVYEGFPEADYDTNDEYFEDKNITLYAIWVKSAEVHFVANGGKYVYTANGKSKEYTDIITHTSVGETTVCDRDNLYREGYTLLGWSKDKNATKPEILEGESYKVGSLVTYLYAVWQKNDSNTYTISYVSKKELDEIEYVPKAQTKKRGEVITLSTEVLKLYGYRFLGWSTDPSATEAEYRPGESYNKDEDAVLYAVWKATIVYTIRYNSNGGRGTPSSQTKTYGDIINLDAKRPTRIGFAFMGWSDNKYDTEAQYQPGGYFSNDEDTTLYAVWRRNTDDTYVITYDANGGTNYFGTPQIKNKGEDIELYGGWPELEGYRFRGWSETQQEPYDSWYVGFTEPEYDYYSKQTYTEDRDITLYAVWIKKSTVRFNANGGFCKYDDGSIVGGFYGTRWVLNGIGMEIPGIHDEYIGGVVQREGYDFIGWAKDNRATTPDYVEGDIFSEGKDVDLFAVWKKQNTNAPTMTVATVNGSAGKEVTVGISIENNPGIAGMTFALDYDKTRIELVGYEDSGMKGWTIGVENAGASWAEIADYTDNGEILKLKFRVLDNAADGMAHIRIIELETFNSDEKEVKTVAASGGVNVINRFPGDINDDGKVDIRDAIRLAKYLAKENVEINLSNANINGDDKVDVRDLIRLKKYLAKMPVTLV